jgi:hypothetical protein
MPVFPKLTAEMMQERLAPPRGRVRVVIDTDTANEIDDQFALAWALLRPDKLDVVAVTAEPFSFAHHLPERASGGWVSGLADTAAWAGAAGSGFGAGRAGGGDGVELSRNPAGL